MTEPSTELLEYSRALSSYAFHALGNDLATIRAALNKNEGTIEAVNAAVTRLLDAYGRAPANKGEVELPDMFWLTDIGKELASAKLWVMNGSLLTIKQAVDIAFGADIAAGRITEHTGMMRITRLMDRGRLTRFSDYSEANPTRRLRVDRRELVAWTNEPPPMPLTPEQRKALRNARDAASRAKKKS